MASLTKDQKKLDRIFSKWVRHKASFDGEHIRCYTCGAIVPIKNAHASHYVDRTHKGTRWDERNVKAACVGCNTFKEGNKDEYTLALIRDYGEGILQELNQAKWIPHKVSDLEIIGMIKYYQEELKKMGVDK